MSSNYINDICGGDVDSWDPFENGVVKPCFTNIIIFGALTLYMALCLTVRVIQIWGKERKLMGSYWAHTTKLVCLFIIMLLPFVAFVVRDLDSSRSLEMYQSIYYFMMIFAFGYSTLVILLEFDRGQEHNWTVKGSWTLAFICGAIKLQTMVAMLRDDGDYKYELPLFLIAYLALTVISVLALFFPSIPEEFRTKDSEYAPLSLLQEAEKQETYGAINSDTSNLLVKRRSISPEDEANIISRILFWWMNEILATGHRRALEENDLYELSYVDQSSSISDLFRACWQIQLLKEAPKIVWAIVKCFWVPFLIGAIFKVIQDFLTFMGPIFLNLIIKYVSGDGNQELWYGVCLALGMMLCSVIQSLCLQTYFFKMFRVGMHLRAAIVTIVYDKAFRLSPKSRNSSSTGDIVNHMAIDAERLMNLIPYLNMVWSGPVQVVVSIGMLFYILGWSVLAGIFLMLIMIPINAMVVKKLTVYQKQMMVSKDSRVKTMNETLQGMRLIKFFAWENSFEEKINGIREEELSMLRKSAYLRAVMTFLWMSTPLMVSIVTFVTYTLVNGTLSADVAFTSISLFNILRFPLNMLPSVISGLVEANVSLKRLDAYLMADELDIHAITHNSSDHSSPNALIVDGASFRWDMIQKPTEGGEQDQDEKKALVEDVPEDLREPTLQNLTFTIPRGSLQAVIGKVGSGKSSLLEGLLGNMPKLSGSVTINGSVAYVAQEAWIQNATLKDNILFGRNFNERRYAEAIKVCELEQDIAMLPGGDATEIGEKGINLSGGQKQRVSMARAVYADADIYLLDDPLSAVDAHVGKAIFENCIANHLKNKTRILVTHQLQFLSQCDEIIVLDNRSIAESGSFTSLMADGRAFSELITKHTMDGGEGGDAEAPDVVTGLDGTPIRESTDNVDEIKESIKEQVKKQEAALIQKEDRQVGEVKASVYLTYIASLGGMLIVSCILLLFIIEQGTKVGADMWVSWWTDDTDAAGDPLHSNTFYLSIYAGIGIANAVATLIRGVMTAIAGIKSAQRLHSSLLNNVLRVPMSFFDTTPVGRILNRFSKDQYVVDEQLPRTLSMFVTMLFAAVAVLVVIGSVTPFFLTALLPLGWLYLFIQKYYLRSSRELKRLDSISRSPIYAHFGETLTGVSTIRAYGREHEFITENYSRLNRNQRAYFVSQVANRWLGIRLEFVGNVVVTLAALFAVLEKDNLEAGSAGLSITYALQTTGLLNWMVRMYTEVETQMVAVERLNEYTDVTQEAPAIIQPRPPSHWPSEGAIEFDDLQLRYRAGLELVLKGVSAKIKPREKIGVVGRTGAGKSTLMLALFRLVEPAGGAVVIDGIDIGSIGLFDLRSKLSIIPQDPTLFTGTIRSNLDPFNEYADPAIWAALEAVHMKEPVSEMDAQLDALVSEGGQNLSVGQRQLMCLGRALLRKSRILVMDEATAAVDFDTDSLIQETIRKEFKEQTVLTIAHRINTIIDSDRVMVLDKGYLAEFDSPDVLLADSSTIFYSLVNKSHQASQPQLTATAAQ